MRGSDLVRAFLDVVYPPRCAVCGRLDRSGLCVACIGQFQRVGTPACVRCGDAPDKPSWTRAVCPACRGGRAFSHARGVFAYGGAARTAVHALKFGGRRSLGELLGLLVAEVLDEARQGGPHDPAGLAPLTRVSLVCAVPLHRSREAARGFNQAVLIAEPIAAAIGRPFDSRLLRRVRETRPQPGLSPAERRANLERAFAAVPGRNHLAGQCVLLVDDLMTTGATADACAGALRAAGAYDVRVLTLCRASSDAGSDT